MGISNRIIEGSANLILTPAILTVKVTSTRDHKKEV